MDARMRVKKDDAGGSAGDGGNTTDADLDGGGRLVPEQGITRHERRKYQGIELVIDRPKGFVQAGKSPDGAAWERTYKNDYGYIDGTAGGDGEPLDVFLGDDPTDVDAHWAVQRKDDGTFDEYKIVLGAGSLEKAEAIYLDHIPSKYLGSWTTTSVEMVKAMLGLHPAEVMKRLLIEELAKSLARDEELAATMVRVELRDGARPSDAEAYEWIEKAEPPAEGDGEMRYVLGPVLVPETTDGQGDIVDADVIERTAHLWASAFRNMGFMHKALINDKIQWVESYIARADHVIEGAQIKAGTWMLGAIIMDDALWDGVKTGKYTGWSIGGFAAKVPA